jgi:hypothetical protein
MNHNDLASQKIRARLVNLNRDLRGSFSVAERPQTDQATRDRCVREVVHFYKQIRRSERALQLMRDENPAKKAERLAAATAARIEPPAESAFSI